ncbi:amidohydrolase [Serratia sp. DD3]|uniref:amidohydrolase n=1 Tax=Serratia sp. DD3 TaxID=1410619 RepID=UPI0003C50CFC|nr:amidohydrolase [Serratia sp. DD3]KEY58851.1 putative hydrolase YxeP [Serratia sp. DD3]
MYDLQSIDLRELIEIRRKIHAHPEAAFEEQRTATLVADYLRACGLDEVHENIGQTGVVGVLRGESSGRSIAFRADMDALIMHEENDPAACQHVSTVTNRFHGCGHDGHTTMLLGAAKYLARHRHFAGTLIFIFQPAEEDLTGAQAMLVDGLLQRFPFEEIYGLHNYPSVPKGEFHVNQKATLSASDTFNITIKGKGGHGAVPEMTIDPIVMAARLISDIQTIVSRNVSPHQAATISFGTIHGGSAPNIIPDSLTLSGTVRTYDANVRALVKQRMQTLAQSLAQGYGGEVGITFSNGCPPLINDPLLAAETVQGLNVLLPEHPSYLVNTPKGPSEDFSCYLDHVKGVYAFLGQGDTPMCHHPKYDFDDEIIPLGVAYWISIAKNRLTYQIL